jgi:hypothetical protein
VAELALPFALDTIPGVRNDPQSGLGDHGFRRRLAGFEAGLAQTIRPVLDSLQGRFNLHENFLLVLDAAECEILFVSIGPQFRQMLRGAGLATPGIAIERLGRQVFHIAPDAGPHIEEQTFEPSSQGGSADLSNGQSP